MYDLDPRCKAILTMILLSNSTVSIQSLCLEFNVSKRSIYYDLDKINKWLAEHNFSCLDIVRNKGISINYHSKEDILNSLENYDYNNFYYSLEDRQHIICCEVLNPTLTLTIEYFMELLKVSRNTIINDLKQVNDFLSTYNLRLVNENKTGYNIRGNINKKCSLFFSIFPKVSNLYLKIMIKNNDKLDDTMLKLQTIESELNTKYVNGVLFSMAMFFSNNNNNLDDLIFSIKDQIEIKKTLEYSLINKYFSEFNENYKLYMSIHLLGSRLQNTNLLLDEDDEEVYSYAELLVNEFEKVACIDISDKQSIINSLKAHLKTSMYRYLYGIQLYNLVLDDIKKEYTTLFEITKKACISLQNVIGVPISDSEVGYITLHFGGCLTQNNQGIKILIVCPNGISTGKMLLEEVKLLVPLAEYIHSYSLSDNLNFNDYDLIITTVSLQNIKNTIVVNPILSKKDRAMILHATAAYNDNATVPLKSVYQILSKYLSKEDIRRFKDDLDADILNQNTSSLTNFKLNSTSLLTNLDYNAISIIDQELSFDEALNNAFNYLLSISAITENYKDTIINLFKQYGPYMFINDHVVLAHAKVSDGSLLLKTSMTILKKPAIYNEKKQALIIIVLAPIDNYSHLGILKDIYQILINDNSKKLAQVNSVDEAFNILKTLIPE